MPILIDIEGPTSRRRRRHRFFTLVLIVLALVAAAGGGIAGAWWFVGNRLNAEIDAYAAKLQAQGGHLAASSRTRAGFPFRPTVVLINPDVAFPPGAPGPWSWSGDKAAVAVSLFAPDALDLSVTGSGHLQLAPLGEPLDLAVQAGTATARITRDSFRESAVVRLANLALAVPSGATLALDGATLTIARSIVPPTDEHSEAFGAHVELKNLTLPADQTTPLGRRLDDLVLDLHVLGPLAPALDAKAFAAWREAGGVAQIVRFETHFGPLVIAADGTLALDESMQPMGAGTGRIRGFAPALDALAASQAMKLNDAKSAKTFLTMLARPPSPGQEPELRVPLTIQERKLYVGPVALLQMPMLDWPGAKAPTEPVAPAAAPEPEQAAPPPPNDDDAPQAAPAPKVERLDER